MADSDDGMDEGDGALTTGTRCKVFIDVNDLNICKTFCQIIDFIERIEINYWYVCFKGILPTAGVAGFFTPGTALKGASIRVI